MKTKSFFTMSVSATLALAVLGGAACGSSDAEDTPGPDAPPVTNPIPDEPTGGDAVGTWAMRRVYSANAQVPVVGVVTTTSLSFSKVTITADGSVRTATDDLCDIVLESSNSLATPSLIASYVAATPTETVTGDLTNGVLTFNPAINVQGATLANPATDAMPTEADDPRVVDHDGDGKPGITVNLQVTGLGAQQLYVVQRLNASWVADGVGTNRIDGDVEFAAYEQVTIGASNPLFDSDAPIVLNATGNAFTLVRVDANFTCDDLLATTEQALFGPR